MKNQDPRYWHNRGYLPHFDKTGLIQFITFRLAGSVPNEVIARWRKELAEGLLSDADFRRRIEIYLDQSYGESHLCHPRIANCLEETLLKFDGERYRLIAWTIMPNHVHLLVELIEAHSMSTVMHSIKSFTAHKANKILSRTGQFWAKEYFDRYIRDSRHFASTVRYIDNNPVKAKLCENPEDWPYGSARFKA